MLYCRFDKGLHRYTHDRLRLPLAGWLRLEDCITVMPWQSIICIRARQEERMTPSCKTNLLVLVWSAAIT